MVENKHGQDRNFCSLHSVQLSGKDNFFLHTVHISYHNTLISPFKVKMDETTGAEQLFTKLNDFISLKHHLNQNITLFFGVNGIKMRFFGLSNT
jgi:hypothetical protein